jgi:biotin-(acetyl-CoA carboxylase) ligase
VTLREVGDAFTHATSIANEYGAGTLVYVGRFDLVEFAVVLEPAEPLRLARRTIYAGMAALADALAVYAQPETAIMIDWPDSIFINGGLVGGGRLAWPLGSSEDAPPAWLVFGAMIRTVSMARVEPGLNPQSTALEEEGFTDVRAIQVVESFARHFMAILDSWQEQGFSVVAKSYLQRTPNGQDLVRYIDENGDLLVRRVGNVEAERKELLRQLAEPAWLDPVVRGPRL